MNRNLFKLNTHVWKNIPFSTCATVYKQSNVSRQGKIFGKLFGKRVSGSKKRWVENPLPSQFQQTSPFQFTTKKVDQNSKRRATILNKLFMSHITDLLATGEASTNILGKGLQITRVKITQNFQLCNVYWMAKGDGTEAALEQELQKCGGHLRHELSQLRLMGEVPRIHFVKDKTNANLALVEQILKDCDFGDDHHEIDPSYEIRSDIYQEPVALQNDDDEEEPLPPMRHDVFGLDRRAIMLKILAKMKKSEKAWEKHSSIVPTQPLDAENESNGTLKEVDAWVKHNSIVSSQSLDSENESNGTLKEVWEPWEKYKSIVSSQSLVPENELNDTLKEVWEPWEKYKSIVSSQTLVPENELNDTLTEEEAKIEAPEEDEAFKKYLSGVAANEKIRKRRFYRKDDGFYRRIGDDEDDQLEDGDYIDDEFDDKK